jgi:hypothetical protein
LGTAGVELRVVVVGSVQGQDLRASKVVTAFQVRGEFNVKETVVVDDLV